MEQGWIKLHRKILENPIIQKPNYLALWVVLLLKANHKEKNFMWNGNIILVKEGQMITGRKELSKETSIPESTIEDILKYLERQHQIQQQKTTKYRIITIVNWIKHQDKNSKSNNNPTTKQQQSDTNKNVKNEKNDNKNIVASDTPFNLEEKLLEMESIENSYLDIIASFIREKPVKIENSKQLSEVITRYCRVAKRLSGAYTNKQIFDAVKKIKIDNASKIKKNQDPIDYTLETILKQLTK